MTGTEFPPDDSDEKPPRRTAGAPKGNCNAWKHGRRSAAAKAARVNARAEIVARLPDARDLLVSVAIADRLHTHISSVIQNAHAAPNKTNNFVAPGSRREEGAIVFLPNKTNNSPLADLPAEAARRRGAPKGNKNALKHGKKSAERRAFKSGLRLFLCRVKASCALAREAERRERNGEILAARGPPKVAARNRVAIVRGPPG